MHGHIGPERLQGDGLIAPIGSGTLIGVLLNRRREARKLLSGAAARDPVRNVLLGTEAGKAQDAHPRGDWPEAGRDLPCVRFAGGIVVGQDHHVGAAKVLGKFLAPFARPAGIARGHEAEPFES